MTMKIELVGGLSQLAFSFFFILISTSIQQQKTEDRGLEVRQQKL
jgi:hypothetical protein